MKNQFSTPVACDDFADLLVDYSDDELAADQRAFVSTHVAGCAGCRAELARLDASRETLAAAIRFPAQRPLAIAIAKNAPARPTSSQWAGWAAAATVVLGALGGSLWFGAQKTNEPGPKEVAMAPGALELDNTGKITAD